jgi:hypothetical protein
MKNRRFNLFLNIIVILLLYPEPMILDIFVQFGKFISTGTNSINWIDLAFRTLGLAAAITIPLYVFYKKVKVDQKKEDEEWNNNNNNDLLYFECLLEDILEEMPKQIQFYKNYVDGAKAKPLSLHKLSLVNIENLNRILNKFDHNRLFHAFIDANSGTVENLIKKFMRIFKHLEFYNTSYLKRIDEVREHQTVLTDYLTKFRDLGDVAVPENLKKFRMGLIQRVFIGDLTLSDKIDKVYQSYGSIPNEEKNHESRFKFIKEIEDLLVQDMSVASDQKMEVLINCRDAKNLYTLSVRRSNYVIERFEQSITRLTEAHQRLKEIFDQL